MKRGYHVRDKECYKNLKEMYQKGYEILHNDDDSDDFKAVQLQLLIDNEISRLYASGQISLAEKRKLLKKYKLSKK